MQETLVVLLIFGGSAAVAISFSPIGGAIAARIRGHGRAPETDPTLRSEVEAHRARLAEMEERLDFAERALTSGTKERS